MSDIEIGVGVWSGHLECQESGCVSDWWYIRRFSLLKLEGSYVVADEGFKMSAWDENQSCAVVIERRTYGDTEFA